MTAVKKAFPFNHLINGRYQPLTRLGSGRLGEIFEAVDEQSGGNERHVALQILHGKLIAGRRFTGEFEQGVQSLQALSHPNIVGMLDSGRDDGHYFLVTEMQDSGSLRFVLNDVGKLPFTEAAAVIRAVGDALQYLHAKSIVHGNVKPENVLVTFEYEVKLLDVVPPEWPAAFAGEPDRRDDVFGLACLAYEMLAGRHPFNANTPDEALRAGMKPAPIATLSAGQWRALAAALELQPENRTMTVGQFLEELGLTGAEKLRAIVAGPPEVPADIPAEPISAVPNAPVQEPPSWVRGDVVMPDRVRYVERPRSGHVGKFLMLLFLAGIGALIYFYPDEVREQAETLVASFKAATKEAAPATTSRTVQETPVQEAPSPLPSASLIEDPALPAAVPSDGLSGKAADVPAEGPPPAAAATTPVATAPAATVPVEARVATTPNEAPVATTPAKTPVVAAIPLAAAPGPSVFGFRQPVVTVEESEVAARIVIRRSGDTSQRASIAWWTDDGTAVAVEDYADLGRRVEQFNAGEVQRTIFVPLTNDADPEPLKSFNVYLGRAGARDASEPLSGVRVDIVDDD